MSRLAPKKIGVGVFAETRLIADSLLRTLQEESDLACLIDGFATAWVHRPDVVVLDWQKATEQKLKPPTEAVWSLLIGPVILTGKPDSFSRQYRVEFSHTLRKLSVRRQLNDESVCSQSHVPNG